MNNTVTRQVLGKVTITSKGEYDSLKSYEILDVVTYQGSSYLSKKYNNNSLPTNGDDWQLLAQKGDTYELSEEDLQRIAEQITSNANSAFNQNVKEKTDSFNTNANSKTEAYNTNATEKSNTYNSNHTAKVKEYNGNASSKLSAYNANAVTKNTEYNSNHTNKINDYNTNASNKVTAYNTNADARFEEYNTNADNKIAEYDEHSEELNNKIVSTRNELERLKSNVLNTGEDTDTFIHVEDSAMAELQELEIEGVTKQTTTTGKNLFADNSYYNVPKNGITISHDNNIVTLTGIATEQYANMTSNMAIEKADTYTFSIDKALSYRVNFRTLDTDGSVINTYSITIGTKSVTFTLTDTEVQAYVYIFAENLKNKTINDTFKIQLEQGSTATSYEPYTGGQPSPSPDYPQEIKVQTGDIKLTSCNKNMTYLKEGTYTHAPSGSTWTIEGDTITFSKTNGAYEGGSLILDTGTTMQFNNRHVISGMYPKISGNYRISLIVDGNIVAGTGGVGALTLYINTDNNVYYVKAATGSKSITIPEGEYITNMTLYSQFITADKIKIKIQLKRGTAATSYVDHLYSQITAKLPEGEFIGKFSDTNKDYVSLDYNKEEGQYHAIVNKYIGKFVSNGTENWIELYPHGYYTNIPNMKINTNSNVVSNIMSNYYTTYSQNNLFTLYDYGMASRSNQSQIIIKNSDIPTPADFKSWLSTHPTETYYLLQNPYKIDLGPIDMPLSYNEITNIFTDSELLPKINAKYYRVFEKTIQNAQINEKTLKQEITDLNATISDLDTRLKALATKTIEEPTESEETV
jgi:hypothetical protein